MIYDGDVRFMKIQTWKASNDYSVLCRSLDVEANNILQYGLEHIQNPVNNRIAYTEIGARSDLHRGAYCPSPVYDIFVGNVKRGHLLKRLTRQNNNYYIYSFEENGKLVCVEHFINGKSVFEHLFYTGNNIYGITLDQWGHIFQVSREIYDNGTIASYCKTLFSYHNGHYDLMNLVKEDYAYSSDGLCQCIFTQYIPNPKLCQQTMYQFQHKNGFLTKYTASDIIGSNPYEVLETSREYDVLISRKV